jgi:hypothetical protein
VNSVVSMHIHYMHDWKKSWKKSVNVVEGFGGCHPSGYVGSYIYFIGITIVHKAQIPSEN